MPATTTSIRSRFLLLALAAALCIPAGPPLSAQTSAPEAPPALTAIDYARAEQFLSDNTNPLVLHAGVDPNWLSDDRFWYSIETSRGTEFVLFDSASSDRSAPFDPTRLAAAFSAASGNDYSAFALPFKDFENLELSEDGSSMRFENEDLAWLCDLTTYRCSPGALPAEGDAVPTVVSPDGSREVFIRDHNLWLRDLASGEEHALTRDGVQDYGYATDNAGWRKSDRPIVLWSPDSRKIATFQQDQRGVGEMVLGSTRVGHPEAEIWKYPLPGDAIVTMVERVVIDTDRGSLVRLRMPPDQHRSSLCDDIICRGSWGDVQWADDSSNLAFLSTSRDHRQEWLRTADIRSGAVREVLSEEVATFFESGNGAINWRYLPDSGEVLWFSERDNWGHLYLYDLATGTLRHQITRGEGNVTRVLRVDQQNRQIYFMGLGFEKGRDPYFEHLYRIGFDGKGLKLLTPENAHHWVSFSPSGDYFVDNYSRPDVAPTAVLRDRQGRLVAKLEEADISGLEVTGWKPPVPIVAKARDGKTDLHGLMFTPTHLDESRKYPIINIIYPGPQSGSVGRRSFSAARGDAQALAELGFVVVKIDGMGTPGRSKSFHEAYYGNMADNTLPDQITVMRQLAQRHPWIDLERVGIYGHSGGGFATAAAMFHHGDFFKVGVAQAGNHDNRVYEDDWGEKWQGLLTRAEDGSSNYDSQANQNFAGQLEGKLLLAHGTMDTNVPFYSTLLVVDALIEANKDFDLILFPNRGHGFSSEPYMMRRRWDYFVEHLMGATPPHEFEFSAEPRHH